MPAAGTDAVAAAPNIRAVAGMERVDAADPVAEQSPDDVAQLEALLKQVPKMHACGCDQHLLEAVRRARK
jgi:hypothetical protein